MSHHSQRGTPQPRSVGVESKNPRSRWLLRAYPGNDHISPPTGAFESMMFPPLQGGICFLVPWRVLTPVPRIKTAVVEATPPVHSSFVLYYILFNGL